jgi:hypothetical protein
VALLDVEAAAISLVFDGTSGGALGASDAARKYAELQFTFGEGPCLDALPRLRSGHARPRRTALCGGRWNSNVVGDAISTSSSAATSRLNPLPFVHVPHQSH